MAENKTGIYEIRNLVNGKRYVGSAVDFNARWSKHLSELRRGVHHSHHLQRSWEKHGPAAFQFKPVIVCSRDNLLLYEQIAMDAWKPAFNVRIRAESAIGIKRRPESIAKTVATRKANGGWSPSAETRAKISATLKGKPGRPHTEESRQKMSAVQKARGTEHLAALWARKIGLPRAPELRIRLSQANARFTVDQVKEIRDRCASGEYQKDVARAFGIRQSCVSEIVRGVTYAGVN